MKKIKNAVLREFDLESSSISEAEIKAVLNTVVIPGILTALTSNILVGVGWIILLSALYITNLSDKDKNAEAFFILLAYLVVGALTAALSMLLLSL